MRSRHTRKTDPDLRGPTIQRAVRLPEVQVQAVLGAIEGGITEIHSVTDAITDALWLWLYENEYTVIDSKGVKRPMNQDERAEHAYAKVEQTQRVDAAQVPYEPPAEATEPTEPDRAYSGTTERPKFSDVDLSVISGD